MTTSAHHPPHTANGRPPLMLAQLPPAQAAAKAQVDDYFAAQDQAWRDLENYTIARRQQSHIYGEQARARLLHCLDGGTGVEAGGMNSFADRVAEAAAAGRAGHTAPSALPRGPRDSEDARAARQAGFEAGPCPECRKRTVVASGMNAACDSCGWATNCYQPRPGVAMAAVPSRFPMPAAEPANGVDPSDLAFAPTDRTVFARSPLGRKAIDHEAARANGSEDVLRAAIEAEREVEGSEMHRYTRSALSDYADDMTYFGVDREELDKEAEDFNQIHQATPPAGADGGQVAAAGVERNAPAAEINESTPGEDGAARGAPAGEGDGPARVGTDADGSKDALAGEGEQDVESVTPPAPTTAAAAALNTRRAKQRRKK